MIESYAVGAVFRVTDEVTPVLQRIATEGAKVDAVITSLKANIATLGRLPGISQLSRQIGGLVRQVERLGTAGAGGTLPLNTQLTSATTEARALTASLQQAAAAARAVRMPGVGGRGGTGMGGHGPGGGGGAGGLHVSGVSVPTPGGHAHIRGGNLAMLGAGALALGLYQEAEVEDIAARAFITGQIQVDAGMTRTDAFKELRSIITRNAISGGFAPKEVGEAVLGSERQFAGLNFHKRMDVLNTMLPFAMQEARLKETPLKESAEALVGLAHMTGTYDVDKLPDLYRKFAYASQLTPKSLPQYTNALSYAMPSLVGGMGMDPDAIMFLTAMNQAAGIGSSKAGTWIQAFFSRLMPASGINLTRSQEKHNAALVSSGLLTKDLKPTWMVTGGDGKTQWLDSLIKLAPMLGDKLSGMEPAARLTWLEGVFGKQGGREAGLMNLPEFVAQFPQLSKQLKMAKGGDDVLKQLTEGSPVQQGRQAWTELTVVMMDIASVVLPPLTSGLKAFGDSLKAMKEYVPTIGTQGKRAAGGAMVGGMIGAGVGFLFGGIGAGPGAVGGAILGGMLTGKLDPGEAGWNKPAPAAVVPGPLASGGGSANSHAENGGSNINVTVKAETDHPDSLADAIMARLAKLLSAAGLHNLGQGEGTHSSAFNSGSPTP